MHVSAFGTSQPWQLPRRTAGHGSKADAGAQPLADSQSASKRIAELEQEIERLQRTEETVIVAPGAPRERGCPSWVVLGGKAIEARPPLTFRPQWCWEKVREHRVKRAEASRATRACGMRIECAEASERSGRALLPCV